MPFSPLCEVPVPRKTHISAKIVCDSVIRQTGCRLTTMAFTYPLFIHNELMTHRMFSRNASSSRAIPITKMIERVLTDPAGPVTWRENCKGMSPHVEMDPDDAGCAAHVWAQAAQDACHWAKKLEEMNVHKEITNRLLAPFSWMTTIVSATDWSNFFALRTHKAAQKEFQVLAWAAACLYYGNDPVEVNCGDWHLPYLTQEDRDEILRRWPGHFHGHCRMISVARCARVSYLTHEGTRDLEKDLELSDRLSGSGHWSPFEHVAVATSSLERLGNFRGWFQFRKHFPAENVTEFHLPGS